MRDDHRQARRSDPVTDGWTCPAGLVAGPERRLGCGRMPDHDPPHHTYGPGGLAVTAAWTDDHPFHVGHLAHDRRTT